MHGMDALDVVRRIKAEANASALRTEQDDEEQEIARKLSDRYTVSTGEFTPDTRSCTSSIAASEFTPSSASSAPAPSLRSAPQGCSELEVDQGLASIRTRLLELIEGHTWQSLQRRDVINDNLVVDILSMTEAIVWGELHDACLFDLFCEHQMLGCFVSSLRAHVVPIPVKVQLLQTISILVQNARRTTSMCYMLSGGLLSALFAQPPDLDDEEVLSYFVTFLKSLALRLDSTTAKLLLAGALNVPDGRAAEERAHGQQRKRLPIFECAVKLVGHRDSMVQTAARTALLNLLRLEDVLVKGVATDVATCSLVPALVTIIRRLCLVAQTTEDSAPAKLQDTLDDLEDWYGFIGDLFHIATEDLRSALEAYGFREENGRVVFTDELAYVATQGAVDISDVTTAGKDVRKRNAAQRFDCVLQHYNTAEALPFPHDLRAQENLSAIVGLVATPLVPNKDLRRAIVGALQAIFSGEALCVDLSEKTSPDTLVQYDRRVEAQHKKLGNLDMCRNCQRVLRHVVSTFHEVCCNVDNTSVTPCTRSREAKAVHEANRYHVYMYTLVSDTPFEKLATSSYKKAAMTLDYYTRLGRTVVLYDQLNGTSTYKREKKGTAYVVKAIRAAQSQYPRLNLVDAQARLPVPSPAG